MSRVYILITHQVAAMCIVQVTSYFILPTYNFSHITYLAIRVRVMGGCGRRVW